MPNTNNLDNQSTPTTLRSTRHEKAKGLTVPPNRTPPATAEEGTVARFDGGHENIVTFNHQQKKSN
ncbi:MAG TPA: hypothetical protein VK211_21825 [Kamptonema sp.]|nr:hypothetical protein [Kamptonema sp.]